MLDQHFSADELAEKFRVHPRTIWRWAQLGEFPQPFRLARNVTRWSEGEVRLWCEAKRRQSPAPACEKRGNKRALERDEAATGSEEGPFSVL